MAGAQDDGNGGKSLLGGARGWSVGVFAGVERLTPGAISGIPYQLVGALRPLVRRVVWLGAEGEGEGEWRGEWRIGAGVLRRVGEGVWWPDGTPRVVDGWAGGWVRRRLVERARARGEGLSRRAELAGVDALIGVMGSEPLSGLRAGVPVLHFSDSTPRLLGPWYGRGRGAGYWRAREEIEREALGRADVVVVATEAARRSVVEEYGVESGRARVVSMGATVRPEAGEVVVPRAIEGRRLRLCMVAADPERKRVGLGVECTERLVGMGWDATLTVVGRGGAGVEGSRVVERAGALRLGSGADRALHRAILARSHLLLMPSAAEAWGIAAAEAGHFGCPSVVSSAGGLPEVVRDGETGLVMGMEAGAGEYAAAIDGLCRDGARYRRMAEGALARARREYTWERCAAGLVEALVPLVGGGRPEVRVAGLGSRGISRV